MRPYNLSDKGRAAIIAANKRPKAPWTKKRRAAHAAIFADPLIRAKISEGAKHCWQDSEFRKRNLNARHPTGWPKIAGNYDQALDAINIDFGGP